MDTATTTTMMLAIEALNNNQIKFCARLDAFDEKAERKRMRREKKADIELEIKDEVSCFFEVDDHPYQDQIDFQEEQRDEVERVRVELERIKNDKRLATNLKSKLKAREKRAAAKASQSNATQSNATQSKK